ncbi:MAG: DsbA family protein [Pseudomonadales bacterium]
MTSPLRRSASHASGMARRVMSRQPPTIEYFHQPDDPYSHLAVQRLQCLGRRYVVRIRPHLVSAPAAAYIGDSERYPAWAVRDVQDIAPHLDLDFPAASDPITPDRLQTFRQKLAAMLTSEDFATQASELGQAFWSGDSLGDESGLSLAEAEDLIQQADDLRTRLGHYGGAMFYFEGEWYWGVDRLRHLEARLRKMNLCHDPSSASSASCAPEPRFESATGANAENVTVEFFPSLRSPYTAISYARVIDLVKRSGARLKLRPVMPMMMRGIPAPRAKGAYIMSDARREADFAGVRFGRIVDPFGEPIKLAFSLYPWACEHGKAVEYLGAYLNAAFSNGVNITSEKGLQHVTESIGLNWQQGRQFLGSNGWEAEIEANVSAMLADGLWGVPSFKVYAEDAGNAYTTWGQDRLWRVESEIARRAL